jgi:cell division protein FtsB
MDSLIRFVRVALPVCLLLLAAIFVPMKVFDPRGLDRVKKLERELEDLEETNAKIRRENDAFQLQIKSFHSNPNYIEKIARDELGMVGSDEVIYQFSNNNRK